jgi:SAM-dependent methyltransferase
MSYPDFVLTPRTRTFERLKKLVSQKDKSFFRALTYESIKGEVLKGKTIDIGGGNNSSYHNLIQLDGKIDSLNNNKDYEFTISGDLNYDLSIESESYDNFICLNTYEHIFNDDKAIEESFRILKNGGNFIISVPFLYRIHISSYKDFNRRTPYWWEGKFKAMGLDISAISIEPLVWDSIATGFFTWRSMNGGLLGKLIMLRSVVKDRKIKEERLPRNINSLSIADFAMGFVIKGKKILL